MSLVGSAAALLGNREVFTRKDGNDSSGLATSIFRSDSRGSIYTSELYGSESYDLNYFFDSPSDEGAHESLYHVIDTENSLNSSRHDARQFNYGLEYLNSQSQDSMSYDEDRVKVKLRELEKVLLDDNGVDDSSDQSMEIDGEWSDATCYALLNDSPKGSSSSDSNISTISSNKEVSFTALTPKDLLYKCAVTIHNGNLDAASEMINELRQRVSIQGEPSERIAAYMVEALAARIATSGRGLYKALKCKEPPSMDRLSAMQVLFEVCPCFRFGFMAANGAILEACKDETTVHIIDFDINQGSQYYTLLQSLARIQGKRPNVRLTGVDDPETVQRSVGGLKKIGQMLELHAKDLHLSFEFHAVPAETAVVSPSLLGCQPGEAVVVNFAFQLHHMPDESVTTVNLRDQLLRMVKSLKPKLVTVVEQDMNTNTTPFLPRFAEAYSYYSAVFESLDATLARDSQDRMNVEKQCLARDIINVVACEGEERIERYEVSGKWRARMTMAGFTPCPVSRNVRSEIQKLIKQYSDRYKVKDEIGALHFGWEDKILIVSSAWRFHEACESLSIDSCRVKKRGMKLVGLLLLFSCSVMNPYCLAGLLRPVPFYFEISAELFLATCLFLVVALDHVRIEGSIQGQPELSEISCCQDGLQPCKSSLWFKKHSQAWLTYCVLLEGTSPAPTLRFSSMLSHFRFVIFVPALTAFFFSLI
ncbi:scarecrow-like protein 1 isoform X2 [Andrographis paniculata]|uniref:scarecrow-like protein 1 isoform X2 n=1 Tax=Andrographis paniculata TaxID=175694 RepID=UPI0021E94395|nr:scarecrow-like protein 1 isoform X2 [Andrographis paniculata]